MTLEESREVIPMMETMINQIEEQQNLMKKAGYATDPSYANRLITIIEDYDLYKYDRKGVYSERKLKKNP